MNKRKDSLTLSIRNVSTKHFRIAKSYHYNREFARFSIPKKFVFFFLQKHIEKIVFLLYSFSMLSIRIVFLPREYYSS